MNIEFFKLLNCNVNKTAYSLVQDVRSGGVSDLNVRSPVRTLSNIAVTVGVPDLDVLKAKQTRK